MISGIDAWLRFGLVVRLLYEGIGVSAQTSLDDPSSYTKLYLYTKKTGANYVEIKYDNLLSLSNLDVRNPTKILIHGWMDTSLKNTELLIRQAYLSSKDLDVNVVSVDWSKTGFNWFYPLPRYDVVPVGKFLAKLIDWMVTKKGVSVGSIHVIGHSLGAQIAGVIGELVTVGRLGRITGLDPAGPGFFYAASGRLDPSDAHFVDVIHTCGGLLGYYDPCGHVDFYPNQGTYNQPGCALLDIGGCSHGRSSVLYAESISSRAFVSTPCGRWQDFADGVCNGKPTIVMGEHVDKRVPTIFCFAGKAHEPPMESWQVITCPGYQGCGQYWVHARGKYYLKTADRSPYALGGKTKA